MCHMNNFSSIRRWQCAHIGCIYTEGSEVWLKENTARYLEDYQREHHLQSQIQDEMFRIRDLFKECYADVSMFFHLRPSSSEYIFMYIQELRWLYDNLSNTDELYYSYVTLVQRAALVLSVVSTETCDEGGFSNSKVKKFVQDVNLLAQNLKDGGLEFVSEEFNSYCLPTGILVNIQEYLKRCYSAMSKKGKGSNELLDIRDIFGAVARGCHIGFDSFCKTLAGFERKLLGT